MSPWWNGRVIARDDFISAELRVAGVVREVARLGDDDDHVAELLDRLVREMRQCITGADHCGSAVAFDDVTFTAAASDPAIAPINDEQFVLGEGPCLHAARTGHVVTADCSTADRRWPGFGDAARGVGIHTMMCAPIRVDGVPVGSLTVFSRTAGLPTAHEGHVLELVAAAVGDAFGRRRHRQNLDATIAGLQEAMNHRAPIEQAKGILMALRSIDADEAFAVLSAESQRTNRKLRTVAAEFVESVRRSEPTPDQPYAVPTVKSARRDAR